MMQSPYTGAKNTLPK